MEEMKIQEKRYFLTNMNELIIQAWRYRKVRKHFFLRSVIFFFVLSGLSGTAVLFTSCKTKPEVVSPRVNEREVLRERAKEYWTYRIEGKVEKAYSCEVPAFREKVTVFEYINRFKLKKYTEAEVVSAELLDDKNGKSSVKTTYIMLLKNLTKKPWTEVREEKWTKVGDLWYHIPEDFENKPS